MPIAYPIWFAGSMLVLAGYIGLALAKLGLVGGFLWITPIVWGLAFMVYAISFHLTIWWADLLVFLTATGFFEAALYFDAWGLRNVL